MPERATSSDREQQRRDNNVSRRQSGLEPLPRDADPDEKQAGGRKAAEEERPRDRKDE